MSENPKNGDVPPEKPAAPVEPSRASTPPKKGWSNPALRMMGIPRISLPLRNWMIFWTLLASIGGGIAYDKYEQKKIREKYVNMVKHLGEEVYENDRIPRKLTIFIAPPPNDYLDESLKIFRKYVKPILNSAAIDYEVYTENRQGDIRSQVAEKIRQLRKERGGIKEETPEESSKKPILASPWPVPSQQPSDDEEGPMKSRYELYDSKDILGLYKIFNPIQPKRDDEIDYEKAGGVICIGRGTYKEYMTGVHEGLLGPLFKPNPLPEPVDPVKPIESNEEKIDAPEEKAKKDDSFEQHDEEEEENDKRQAVEKPWIRPNQYKEANLAPELDMSTKILNNKRVPVLFEQPMYVYPVPNLLGFLNMPHKIYRYFTKRRLAEEYGQRTLSIIYNLTRDFEYKDQLMAKDEEVDWPKKWVEKGKSKNSEWVQELQVDERITTRMKVFDPQLIDQNSHLINPLSVKNPPKDN